MIASILLICVQVTSILSQTQRDVPQPTLVCRGLGCSEALSQRPGPPRGLTQKRLGQFGPIQTCFFNRCQISGPGFFATQSCFGGPCSQTFSSSSSFSTPTRAFSQDEANSPDINSQTFSSSNSLSIPTRAFSQEEAILPNNNSPPVQFSEGNIFGSGGLFAQIFGKKR